MSKIYRKKLAFTFLILALGNISFAQTKRVKTNSVSKRETKRKTKECEKIISLGVMPPNLVKEIHKPEYPPAAQKLNIKDDVSVIVKINKRGKVIDATIQRGHPLLRKVSLKAALKSKFRILRVSKTTPICYYALIVYKFKV